MYKTKGAVWVDDGWGDGHFFADHVYEAEEEYSPLLGPDGYPLVYEKQPMGFDLTPREDDDA